MGLSKPLAGIFFRQTAFAFLTAGFNKKGGLY
jgi:hypothetical protein